MSPEALVRGLRQALLEEAGEDWEKSKEESNATKRYFANEAEYQTKLARIRNYKTLAQLIQDLRDQSYTDRYMVDMMMEVLQNSGSGNAIGELIVNLGADRLIKIALEPGEPMIIRNAVMDYVDMMRDMEPGEVDVEALEKLRDKVKKAFLPLVAKRKDRHEKVRSGD